MITDLQQHLFTDLQEHIYNSIYQLGEYGNFLLIPIAVIALYFANALHYLGIFFIGTIINIILNFLLKGIIRQPRPRDNVYIHSVREKYQPIKEFGKFGMPSGHTQGAFFTLVFLYLVTKNNTLLAFNSIITLVVIWQRVHGQFHTIPQILAGAVVGSLTAYLFYSYGEKTLKGNQHEKKDDNYFGLGN